MGLSVVIPKEISDIVRSFPAHTPEFTEGGNFVSWFPSGKQIDNMAYYLVLV